MRKLPLFLVFAFAIFSLIQLNATKIIDPDGDGGFNLGSTFTDNGWTVVNGSATSTQNQWTIGSCDKTLFGANNVAYITNNTTTQAYSYTNNGPMYIVHFYKTVTFPAGETNIKLAFNWKCNGGSYGYDGFQVSLANTTVTPAASATAQSGAVTAAIVTNSTYVGNVFYYGQTTPKTECITIPSSVTGNSTAAKTKRLIFTFRIDASNGFTPPAIDDISLISLKTPSMTGIYYINNTLPTTNPMVHNNTGNFNNFVDAVDYLNTVGVGGPVTFKVSSNQVFTQLCPKIFATGTSTNTITFVKEGTGNNPLIQILGKTKYYPFDCGISLWGSDYITFNGIDIDGSGSTDELTCVEFGYLLRNASPTNGTHHDVIKNCSVTLNKNYGSGVAQSGAIVATNHSSIGAYNVTSADGLNNNNSILNFQVSNATNGVLLINNAMNYFESGNIVGVDDELTKRNLISNISNAFYSIQAITVFGQIGCKVFNCDVTDIYSPAGDVAGMYIQTRGGTIGCYNNKVYNIHAGSADVLKTCTGIDITNSTNIANASVYNNCIYDIHPWYEGSDTGLYTTGLSCNVGNGSIAKIMNNTIEINLPSTSSMSSMCLQAYDGNVDVEGNILVNTSAGTNPDTFHHCIFTSATDGIGGSSSVSNYNDLYLPNNIGTTGSLVRVDTEYYNTLTDWKSSSYAKDINSISINPLFVSTTDLTPNSSQLSAYPGYTTPAWLTYDLAGNLRSSFTPSDLGAYAFNVVSPEPAVTPNPANSASDVSINPTLSWSPGSGLLPTGYHLYLGTDNPPTNLVNGMDLGNVVSYQPVVSLLSGVQYYWQIVPYIGGNNAVNCPVWSFSTILELEIPVVSIQVINGISVLTWDKVTNANSYIVKGSDIPYNSFTDITGTGTFSNTANTVSWSIPATDSKKFFKVIASSTYPAK